MTKLLEYQGKKLLAEQGIPVPAGDVATTAKSAYEIAQRLGKPVALKAQVGVTGRFKAGGVKFAGNPQEAAEAARELIGKDIKGARIEKVLVEEKLDIKQEMYAGIIVDDSHKVKGPVLMFSPRGGVDIEETAAREPDMVAVKKVNILDGLDMSDAREMVSRFDIPRHLIEPVSRVVYSLYQVFRKYDARSAEINPLVITADEQVYPADCRIVLDQASIFRHPELGIEFPREIGRAPTELERIGWQIEEGDYRGTGYFVQLAWDFKPGEGYLGFHGLGGGGAMLGADAVIRHGLKLANYAETSGNPTASKVYRVVKLVFSQPNIDGYVMMGAMMASQEQWH
ncbi:MAG: acetate--CoA ligase family protein, partial [Dehalococcoidales bacterium]|nr:acetate--CoA ligase family protein [Dehalococcoidales bacterium]